MNKTHETLRGQRDPELGLLRIRVGPAGNNPLTKIENDRKKLIDDIKNGKFVR